MVDEADRRVGEHADLLRKRADLLARKGDLRGALATTQRLCERHPDDASAWLGLAQLSLELQAFDQAEQAARRARNAAPDAWQPYFTLGLAHDAKDDLAEAEAAYREAVRREPATWQPANNLGLTLLARGGAEAVAEAEQLFAHAAKLAGSQTLQPSYNRALALARQGNRAEFIKLKGKLLASGLAPAARDRLAAVEQELAADE
jgi:Flp pilus assembly protein TadD